jgi:hypothetical protein
MVFEREYDSVMASHCLEQTRPVQKAAIGHRYAGFIDVNQFVV